MGLRNRTRTRFAQIIRRSMQNEVHQHHISQPSWNRNDFHQRNLHSVCIYDRTRSPSLYHATPVERYDEKRVQNRRRSQIWDILSWGSRVRGQFRYGCTEITTKIENVRSWGVNRGWTWWWPIVSGLQTDLSFRMGWKHPKHPKNNHQRRLR